MATLYDFTVKRFDTRAEIGAQAAREVRDAINRILSEQLRQAVEEIREGRPAVDQLVERLLNDNRLTGEEIDRILSGAGA